MTTPAPHPYLTSPRPLALALGCLTLALGACTENSPSASSSTSAAPGRFSVVATDVACQISGATAPAGTVTFSVTNKGTSVTEFYLLAQDKLRIVGEVENIGPGLTRDLVLKATPGTYYTSCKPGMKGSGFQNPFTVTGSASAVTETGPDAELVAAANTAYASYVKDQTEQLVTATDQFVAAWRAGRTDEAKTLYPKARQYWERIEPVAESFGDLDPKMDAREADLEPGQAWTGWHTMEKDLWPPSSGYTALTAERRKALADGLVADTKTLYDRTRTITFTTDRIANGAKDLMDEVATGKVTGEEEIFSHTDLWDFQANVDGARVAWEGLRPVLKRRDAALDTTLETRFAALQKLLDKYRKGDGFVSYTELTQPQVRELSDAVNGLGEPLSKLTAAVV